VNLLLALVLFGISLAAVAWGRWKTGDYASPGVVVVAVWGTTGGLFLLRLLAYPALPAAAAGALLLGVGSLLAGILLARPLSRHVRPREWLVSRPGAWVAVFSLLGLVGVLWYGWEVSRLFGPEALLHDATRIRVALTEHDIPSRFMFLQFFCMIAPILALGFALGGVRIGFWPWALAGICALSTWFTTDRTQFFTIVLVSLFLYFLRRGSELSLGRAVASVLVAGIALAGNFLAVGYWIGKSPENLGFALSAPRTGAAPAARPQVAVAPPGPPLSAKPGPPAAAVAVAPPGPSVSAKPGPPAGGSSVPATPSRRAPDIPSQAAMRRVEGALEAGDSATSEPETPVVRNRYLAAALRKSSTLYLYSTGSFAAFALWFPPNTPLTHGVHSIYPVARFLERTGVIRHDLPPSIPGFVNVVRRGNDAISFNGYTFLYYPISDFGVVWAAVYCLLVGLLVGTVYERTRRARSSSLHLLVMGQLSVALTLSPFLNKFNNTASWYLAVMTTAPFWGSALARLFRKAPR
jgi:hypothetical protein